MPSPKASQPGIRPAQARKRAARNVYGAVPAEALIRAAETRGTLPLTRRKAAASRQNAAALAHRLAAELVARYWPDVSKHAAARGLAAALSGGPCPPGAAAMVAAVTLARQKAGLAPSPSASQLRRDLMRME